MEFVVCQGWHGGREISAVARRVAELHQERVVVHAEQVADGGRAPVGLALFGDRASHVRALHPGRDRKVLSANVERAASRRGNRLIDGDAQIAIDDAGGVSHARSELCAAAARYVMNDSAAGFVERIPGGDVGGYRRASGARFTLGEGPTGRGALAASHGREAIARQLARTSGLVTALLNLSAVRPEHGAAARRAAVGGCVDAVAAEIRAARGLAARAAPFTGAALRAAVARLGVAVVALLAAFQHAVTAAQARHDGRFHDGALRDHLIRIAALA